MECVMTRKVKSQANLAGRRRIGDSYDHYELSGYLYELADCLQQ